MRRLLRQKPRHGLRRAHQHSESQSGTVREVHCDRPRVWRAAVIDNLRVRVSQSDLAAELFQPRENDVAAVADGSVRSGKRATGKHRLTVGFQVSRYGLRVLLARRFTDCSLCLCSSVPSVPTVADGHPRRHRSALRPLY